MVYTDLVQYRYVNQYLIYKTPLQLSNYYHIFHIYTPLRLTSHAADILTSHRASNTLTGDLFSGKIYTFIIWISYSVIFHSSSSIFPFAVCFFDLYVKHVDFSLFVCVDPAYWWDFSVFEFRIGFFWLCIDEILLFAQLFCCFCSFLDVIHVAFGIEHWYRFTRLH